MTVKDVTPHYTVTFTIVATKEIIVLKVKLKHSRYRPEVAQRVPGS
jgi:hypothetical protein